LIDEGPPGSALAESLGRSVRETADERATTASGQSAGIARGRLARRASGQWPIEKEMT
jgi:hypothetical protein